MHTIPFDALNVHSTFQIVALGGIAAATNFCYSNTIFNVVVNTTSNVNITDGSGEVLQASSLGSCVSAFSLNWWAIWLEFFLLSVMFGTCWVNAFNRARFIYLSYLSMSTFFLTISARDFITASLRGGGVDPANYSLSAYNAAAAGAILLALVNYCLIIFLGMAATTEIPDNVMVSQLAFIMPSLSPWSQLAFIMPSLSP